MRCSVCGKRAEKAPGLCSTCLARAIEKRAAKELRSAAIFREARVAVVNDGSGKGQVCEYLARKLITIAKITATKKMPRSGYDFVLSPETADDEAAALVEFMLESKGRGGKAAVRLLKDTTESEAEAYARIKNIKYAPSKNKKPDAGLMVSRIEGKYPGTVFALAKAASQLKWQK